MNLPYMFAGFKNGEHTSKNALLCIVLDGGDRTAKPLPAEITDCDLKYGVAQVKPGCHPPPPAPLGISLQGNPGWDVLCPALASIVPCFRPCTLPHRIWPRFIYQAYFKPLDIPRGKYFVCNKAEAQCIVAASTRHRLDDFIWPREGPIPVAHFSLIAPASEYLNFTGRAIKTGELVWERHVPPATYEEGPTRRGFLQQLPNQEEAGEVIDWLVSARDDPNDGGRGVTTVPYTASTCAVGTGYESQRPVGDDFTMKSEALCCATSRDVIFPVRQKLRPHEWVPPGLRGCCGGYTRFSVELAAAASSMALQPAVLDPAPNGRCARRLDRCVDRCLKSVAVQVDADIAPRDAPAGEQELRTLELGDGGTNDAYAILPLVQQQVENIIAVVSPDPANSFVPKSQKEMVVPKFRSGKNCGKTSGITRYADIYHYAKHGTEPPGPEHELDRWILAFGPPFASLFGWMSIDPSSSVKAASLPLNTVFGDGRCRLRELKHHFDALFREGKPLIYTLKHLKVLANPFWGTKAYPKSYCCNLTVICYYLPAPFANLVSNSDNAVKLDPCSAIPLDRADPSKGFIPNSCRFEGEYEHVPELKIAMEGPNCCDWRGLLPPVLNLDSYTPGQVNLTAYLGTWMVDQAWHGLCAEGKPVFGGFDDMFKKKCEAAAH